MYKKIIVPLDGSKLAEEALAHLNTIAKGCGTTEVVLVTVTEKVKGKLGLSAKAPDLGAMPVGSTVIFLDRFTSGREFSINPEVKVNVTVGKMAKTGHDYLVKIAQKLEKKGIQTSIAVLIGNVAEEITHFAKEEKADLIIMATQGKTGLRKFDVANVGQKILKTVENIPVLMVKPPFGFKETKPVRKGKPS